MLKNELYVNVCNYGVLQHAPGPLCSRTSFIFCVLYILRFRWFASAQYQRSKDTNFRDHTVPVSGVVTGFLCRSPVTSPALRGREPTGRSAPCRTKTWGFPHIRIPPRAPIPSPRLQTRRMPVAQLSLFMSRTPMTSRVDFEPEEGAGAIR